MERDLETGLEREIHGVGAPSLYEGGMDLSPDGQQLAFVVREEESQSNVLKVVPVAGGPARDVLRETPPLMRRKVVWAPDGRSLLFARRIRPHDSYDAKAELWLISAEGGEPRKLDLAAEGMNDLCIHPDGRHVAYTSGGTKVEIWALENFLPPAEATVAR